MSSSSRIDIIRKTWKRYIADNPYTIVTWDRPTIDNGYGTQIPDLTQAPVESTRGIARVCRRRLPDPIIANSTTPYDFQDVYYILVEYDQTWLKKDLIFEYYGQKYRTQWVEDRIMLGGIAYRLSNLEQVTSTKTGD